MISVSANACISQDIFTELTDNLFEYVVKLYSLFTDVYLLRRILDKNEIKKCIIYSGIQHSLNYIYFLMYDMDVDYHK